MKKAKWLRNKVLNMAVKAGAGHIAPSFSCADILISLYYGGGIKVDPDKPKWPNRDRFVLSKGQAAVALYAVLADKGFFPVKELDRFTQPGSSLGGHTEDNIIGVEAFTGSLGHGLPISCGLALGAKIDKKRYKVITLLGDGECHEGSVWEAAMFAAHHRLDNLLVIVDNNGLSATDHLSQYLEVESLEEKWRAFGWKTTIVDGHSFDELIREIQRFRQGRSARPFVIIAKTVKGKGVSFMENRPIWHYRIP
ncbi:transketolase, partial [Elusimicrobiota bacterium]